ncbi:MAG: hypothetical protein HY532_03495 [Chloroflexi bacterium]|nr:hypothetical protein [Chloroflexota bacterium]
MILLALLGLLLSGALTIVYYTDIQLPCFIGSGCDVVSNEQYATFFAIPWALLGVAGYGLMIVTTYGWLIPRQGGLLLYALVLAALTFTGYLIYLEGIVAKVACSYCFLGYLIPLAILIVIFAPSPLLSGIPFQRHRRIALAVIIGTFLLTILSHR